MEQKKAYSGIDIFRLIAALLVITNHVSPLADISATGDFILARILARLAVPFFFMTSGFFLIRDINRSNGRLTAFIKKNLIIYGAAILICLPINLYNNYFSVKPLLSNIARDLLFNGTLYHLWYLPASIIGGVIAWFAIKKLGYKISLAITSALYLFGLLGNGYYGITAKVPFLKGVFDEIFSFIGETRNGIFFAPLFIVLGGYLYSCRDKLLKPVVSAIGFTVSLGMMISEGLILRHLNLQRLDSMYLLLPIVLYFLFSLLASFRGKRYRFARDSALLIYILHPIVIVAVRFAADILGLDGLLIDNNLVHYSSVTVITVIAVLVLLFIKNKLFTKKIKTSAEQRSWIELDISALNHDVSELRRIMPDGCSLMAVVKAEAYGHGAFEIVEALHEMKVDAYGVATVDEGIALRKYGVKGLILVMGYTDPSRANDLKKYRITQTVFDLEYANKLNNTGKKNRVHIGIDSGMHRIGISASDIDGISSLFSMKNLIVDGIFSHLCVSDSSEESDIAFTDNQISAFNGMLNELKNRGYEIKTQHIQSSYGLINYPELKCDYARIGISLYGVDSASDTYKSSDISLKPVMSLKTKIIQLRTLEAGESVGYGRAFVTERKTRVAVLPIGYADGFPRCLSGKASVIICGKKASVIGRICMDQMMVDVTDIEDAKLDSVATLIGTDGNVTITAEEVAFQAETITNEIFSRLGKRLDIIVK